MCAQRTMMPRGALCDRREIWATCARRCGTLNGVDLAYPCMCCGYRTLSEPPSSDEFCVVCRWEDDVYQLRWPNRQGGAIPTSLIDAQRNVLAHGVSNDGSVGSARVDAADYERDP